MIRQTGMEIKIVRNDVPLSQIVVEEYEGLILSPGPGLPSDSGNLMKILHYYHDKLPILGICLGHQAIGEYFGADLVKGAKPVHGKISEVTQIKTHPILHGLPLVFKVTRYHSLELTNLPPTLDSLLTSSQGEIMALAHKLLPIIGLQYHPEAHLTEYGLELVWNWVRYCVESRY